MNKILVTGGAGYIGSHTVVELFNAGDEAVVLDNFSNAEQGVLKRIGQNVEKPVKLYEGDCNDEKFVKGVLEKEGNISGIIHFAAYKAVGESVEKPLNYYENNIVSLLTLLKNMPRYDVKCFVFSSSCTVYGQPDQLPVSELTPKKEAESPYGNTKRVCEKIIEDTVKSKVLIRAVTLRYFNPVGAHPSS